jgi:hypothetical protein
MPEHEPPVPKPAVHEDSNETTILKKKAKISINIKSVGSSPPDSPTTTNNTNSSELDKQEKT